MSCVERGAVTADSLHLASRYSALFFFAIALAHAVLPGTGFSGVLLPDGTRKRYKLNGWKLFVGFHIAVFSLAYFGFRFEVLLQHFWSFFIVANGFSVFFTLLLLAYGWSVGDGSTPAARSSLTAKLVALFEDLWLGTQLNPQVWCFDAKMFMYIPSLFALHAMVLSFAFAQYNCTGTLTPAMLLYQGFTAAYLATHWCREEFMLTTWDIIAERFGFMLVWGDLVYVPFFYSICGWYIVDAVGAPGEGVFGLGWGASRVGALLAQPAPAVLAAAAVVHLVGHFMFRQSNWQKDSVRASAVEGEAVGLRGGARGRGGVTTGDTQSGSSASSGVESGSDGEASDEGFLSFARGRKAGRKGSAQASRTRSGGRVRGRGVKQSAGGAVGGVTLWGAQPDWVSDSRGRKLLVSGWWGVVRKPNYTGEMLVYLSFALCSGFTSVVPYILPASLVILLMQRAWRDNKRCEAKYGALWKRYCATVKHVFVPGVV